MTTMTPRTPEGIAFVEVGEWHASTCKLLEPFPTETGPNPCTCGLPDRIRAIEDAARR